MTQRFHIARSCLSLEGDEGDWGPLPPAYEQFCVTAEATPDGVVSAHRSDLPRIDGSNATVLCDAAPTWCAWSWRGGRVVVLEASAVGGTPWRHLLADDGANRWTVVTSPDLPFLNAGSPVPHPLAFPVGELVTIELLAHAGGALFHACGIDDRGHGFLLCGRSGAGKSTMARLVHDATRVLNDDRVIVTLDGGAAFIHGTPWHGDFADVRNQSAPLAGIFFLEQSPTAEVVALPAAAAVRRLLGACWLPVWSPQEHLPRVLRLCRDLAAARPCFILRFRPEKATLAQIREACAHAAA